MKQMIALSVAIGIVCATPVLGESLKRIKTEEEYRARIVDRTFVNDKGDWVVAKADGSMTGQFGGKTFSGKWLWSGGYWCRNGTLGGKEIGSDCQVIEFDGRTMRNVRKQGKGNAALFTVQ